MLLEIGACAVRRAAVLIVVVCNDVEVGAVTGPSRSDDVVEFAGALKK